MKSNENKQLFLDCRLLALKDMRLAGRRAVGCRLVQQVVRNKRVRSIIDNPRLTYTQTHTHTPTYFCKYMCINY